MQESQLIITAILILGAFAFVYMQNQRFNSREARLNDREDALNKERIEMYKDLANRAEARDLQEFAYLSKLNNGGTSSAGPVNTTINSGDFTRDLNKEKDPEEIKRLFIKDAPDGFVPIDLANEIVDESEKNSEKKDV